MNDPNNTQVLILGAGWQQDSSLLSLITPETFVIAADGGLALAAALQMNVHLAVGDFDSADAHHIDAAKRNGARIVRHPEAKDQTDFELAVQLATERGPSRLLVAGVIGDRLDHSLASLHVLCGKSLSGMKVTVFSPLGTIHVVHDSVEMSGAEGDLVSLLPLAGPAVGVTTSGLVYALTNASLDPLSSLGVSNVFARRHATVSVQTGVVLAIRPQREALQLTTPP